ncbi:Variant surface glycoprotein [Trypanosoma congolense IL3000]|uniref:Variant surface glycoprotein n=1 Tax=Trypanosoma congolense (strain IL3000) TaxID=1068625 RepID=F9WHM1_TRYCI|nr:Variant surface glycoprotein [Trypanosoma congolense IL3000]
MLIIHCPLTRVFFLIAHTKGCKAMVTHVIGAFLLYTAVVLHGMAQLQSHNKEEFRVMCKLLSFHEKGIPPPQFENVEKENEIIEEMELLERATGPDVSEFESSVWKMKKFLKEHPPPEGEEARKVANEEIKQLLQKAEEVREKSDQNRNSAIAPWENAQLKALQAVYGDHIENLTKYLDTQVNFTNNTEKIFESIEGANYSCGGSDGTDPNKGKAVGKTLINDIFCLCVGECNLGNPCHDDIGSPNKAVYKQSRSPRHIDCSKDKTKGKWTQIKYKMGSQTALSFTESWEAIKKSCDDVLKLEKFDIEINATLTEFEKLLHGDSQSGTGRKILGYEFNHTKLSYKCIGNVTQLGDKDNNLGYRVQKEHQTCVDYTYTLNTKKEIPWRKKIKEALNDVTEMEYIVAEEQTFLAELIKLKNSAWMAYNKEKDEEFYEIENYDYNKEEFADFPKTHLLFYTLMYFSFAP